MADLPPSLQLLSANSLVGRECELTVLRQALEHVLVGRGQLALISGEAGIGKTALAETLLAEARQRGAVTLVGRCYDLAETPPYGPWRELFAEAPRDRSLPALPAATLSPGTGGETLTSQDAIVARVRAYLAALAARRPLILLLDDLHWADHASLDLLRAAARGLDRLPLLLLATHRADELTRDGWPALLLPLLVREVAPLRLTLAPLTAGDLDALVQARYGLGPGARGRLAAYLQARAEGNPLYIGELLRTLEESRVVRQDGAVWALDELATVRVPPLLYQLIEGRVERLSREAQRLLSILAVIGQDVPVAFWQTLGGVGEEALQAVVDEAVAARLLDSSEDGASVRFAHALTREAIYAGIPPLRRRAWHRLVAEALEALLAPDPEAVAHHFFRAGDLRGIPALIEAGERAQRAYAWTTAAERYEAALALADGTDGALEPVMRGWLAARLAQLRRYTDPKAALRHLDLAASCAAAAGDRALAAQVLLSRGLLRCFDGEVARGLAELRAGVAALDTLAPEEWVSLGTLANVGVALDAHNHRGTLAFWLALSGHYGDALALSTSLAPSTPRADPAAEADLAHGIALARSALGQPAAARVAFARARRAYRALGYSFHLGWLALHELCWLIIPYHADRPAVVRALTDATEAAWANAGGVYPSLLPRMARLPLLLLTGEWAEAVDLGASLPPGGWRAPRQLFTTVVLGPLARLRGELEEAWSVVRAEFPAGPTTPPGDSRALIGLHVQCLATDLALDTADLPAARAWLDAHDRWLAWCGAVLESSEGQIRWARLHRLAGDERAARRHAEAALSMARAPRQPLALLTAHRLLGQLAVDGGHAAEAEHHLHAAMVLAEACTSPYERACTLLVLAQLALERGAAEEAARRLAVASAIAEELGAHPLLTRLNALAHDLPAEVDRQRNTLTGREREVATLVAEGRSNRSIAAALSIGERTVETHIGHILAKLGGASRAQIAAWAVEHLPK